MPNQPLTFAKADILLKLKSGREEHLASVQEAQKGYREKLIAMLEERLSDAKEGRKVRLPIHMHLPESHVEDYDRVIAMLEMCTETELELNEMEFRCWVLGEWQWGGRFLQANSAYSALAARRVKSPLFEIDQSVQEVYDGEDG